MDEKEFASFLHQLIGNSDFKVVLESDTAPCDCEIGVQYVSTFEEEGVFPWDEGLVIRLLDMSKFYLTVKRVW